MNGKIDDKIKKSLTPFLPLIGLNQPTKLSFLKTKYPFLNDRINVKIYGRWYMSVGGNKDEVCPSGNRYKLLIEGEETIHLKNNATGETTTNYNMFYVGEIDGNPLVALRCCSDKMFKCQKSDDDNAVLYKNSIESFDDLWMLKKAE